MNISVTYTKLAYLLLTKFDIFMSTKGKHGTVRFINYIICTEFYKSVVSKSIFVKYFFSTHFLLFSLRIHLYICNSLFDMFPYFKNI